MTHPCHSPYCECDTNKCTHPGFHDARDLMEEPKMQTINILLETDPRVILMNALADLMETTDHSLIFHKGISKDVTVEVKINGIEVDYVKVFEVTLQEHFANYDKHIKEKAKELLKEKFSTLINSLYDLEGISDKIIDEHCNA